MPYDYVDDLKLSGIALRAWGSSLTDMFMAAANGTVHAMAAHLDFLDFRERRTFVRQEASLQLLLADFLQVFIDTKHADQVLMRPAEAILTQERGEFKIRVSAEATHLTPEMAQSTTAIKRVDPQRIEIVEKPEGWAAALVLEP